MKREEAREEKHQRGNAPKLPDFAKLPTFVWRLRTDMFDFLRSTNEFEVPIVRRKSFSPAKLHSQCTASPISSLGTRYKSQRGDPKAAPST